jgi:hypothetical protein
MRDETRHAAPKHPQQISATTASMPSAEVPDISPIYNPEWLNGFREVRISGNAIARLNLHAIVSGSQKISAGRVSLTGADPVKTLPTRTAAAGWKPD